MPEVPDIDVDDLPPDWRYVWEERSAITEYDGGLPKEHAEAAALADTLEVMRRSGAWPVRRRLNRWRPGPAATAAVVGRLTSGRLKQAAYYRGLL